MKPPYTLLFVFILFIYCSYAAERDAPTAVPRGWTRSTSHKRANLGANEITIKVALTQRNLDQLEAEFWTVSDPQNSNYGNYKTFEEVVDWVAPTQATIDVVTGYFQEKGLRSDGVVLSAGRDFMTLSLRVEQAEEIFQTVYEPYEHSKTRGVAMKMVKNYYLDDQIDAHIDFITHFSPITQAPAPAAEMNSEPIAAAPEKVSRATRAANNGAPFLLHPWADNAGVAVEVIFTCPSGNTPTLSSGKMSCGSVGITKLNYNLVSQITHNSLLTGTIDLTKATIYSCSDSRINSTCAPVAALNQLSPNSPFYAVYLLPNITYVPYVVSVSVSFSDGSSSPTTTSNVVAGSDIAYPANIFAAYSIPSGTKAQASNNKQSVVSFLGQSYNTNDLKQFFQLNGIPDYSNLVSVIHPQNNNPNSPGTEGSLDIQGIMGVAQNCHTDFYANPLETDFLTWIDEALGQKNAAWVYSSSYGISEDAGFSNSYFSRINSEFQKAGVRGITLLYSSMDDGPYEIGGLGSAAFSPAFPASSPYVTAVGGTMWAPSNDPSCFQGDQYNCEPEEIVCSIGTGAGITSGGGFSNAYSRPSYQDSLVTPYLSNVQAAANTKGRGYPDISMIGHNAPVVQGGKLTLADGTSASAPYLAGFVTLWNDMRLAAGKPTLGFLNPVIYQMNASAFKDITQGSANCSHLNCYQIGLPATPGWDAATGRGSPIFSEWTKVVLDLPAGSASSINVCAIFIASLLLAVLVL